MIIEEWIKEFPWESEEQEKGFKNFLQFVRKLPASVKQTSECEIPCAIAYFIQKDKESHDWWVEFMSKQVSLLEEQIQILQTKNQELEKRIAKCEP